MSLWKKFTGWVSGSNSSFFANSAFNAASYTRDEMRGWLRGLYAPNDELSNANRTTIIARIQDAIRNDPIASAAIQRFVTEIINSGIKPDHSPDINFMREIDSSLSEDQIKNISSSIEKRFKLWCKSPVDVEQENNYYAVQRLIYRSQKTSGDVFVNTPIVNGRLYLQIIESERVSNPNGVMNTSNTVDGVQINNLGVATHFHVQVEHPGQIEGTTGARFEWKRIRVRDSRGRKRFFQVMERKRPDQRRGLPVLAVVLESIKQLDRFTRAELFAAVITSNPTLFVESPYGSSIPNNHENTPAKNKILQTHGAVYDLAPGEKITSPASGRPNPLYEPFHGAKIKHVAMALNMPIEIFMMHFTASFTAGRGAFLLWKKVVGEERSMFNMNVNDCVASVWLDNEVDQGRIDIPNYSETHLAWKSYFSWNGVAMGSIKELEQLKAARERIELKLSNHEKEAKLLGNDWDEVVTRLEQEEARIGRSVDNDNS